MRVLRTGLLPGVLWTAPACAQIFSVGVLGGAPFTNVISSDQNNNVSAVPRSSNFVVGPTVQINLPLSLRVEADALYRPYSFQITSLGVPGINTVSAMDWDFPFLLQYRIANPLPHLKPFVEVGVSFDHLADISAAAKNVSSGPGTLIRQSNAGVVLGGGVDLKIPFIRISGELRYTHQGSADFQALSNLNQAEVLVGVHF
jgi:hypothetical protein